MFLLLISGSVSLQHLPDFKGIETPNHRLSKQRRRLQHLPDFKGIETATGFFIFKTPNLQHLPDFKGIETVPIYNFSSQ